MITFYIHPLHFRKQIMETIGVSTKLKCLIGMALEGDLSWTVLDSMINGLICLAIKQKVSWTVLSSFFVDDVSTTLSKSKQVIKILLKMFENLTENIDPTVKKAMEHTTILDQSISLISDYLSEHECEVVKKETSLKNGDSENFRLIDQYKDKLYTFVGDDFEGKSGTDDLNESNGLDKFSSKDKPVDSKASEDKTKRNPYLCNTCTLFYKKSKVSTRD